MGDGGRALPCTSRLLPQHPFREGPLAPQGLHQGRTQGTLRSPRIEFLLTEQETGGMRKLQLSFLVPGDICSGSLGGCHIWITIVVTFIYLFFHFPQVLKTSAFPPVSRRGGMFVSLSKVTSGHTAHPAPPRPPHLISFFAVFIKWSFSLSPFYLAGQGGAEEVIR